MLSVTNHVLSNVTDEANYQSTLSQHLLHADAQNASSRKDCIRVVFSKMPYLPWDNPDNIVSAEVEAIVHRVSNNLLVLLFLIGGPVNLFNMAVFYKHGLRDRVNLCLFSLSLTDELFLIVMMVIQGEQLHTQFTTKEKFGPIMTAWGNNNLNFLLCFSVISPALSTIIAAERCLCVTNPLRFQALLRTKTMAAIIASVTVVFTGLYFIVAFRYRIGCLYDPVIDVVIRTAIEGSFYKSHKDLINGLHIFLFGVGLPSIEMTLVTITTTITIVKLRQVVTWRSSTSSSVISAKEVALTKVLVGNSIFFIACSSPVTAIRFSMLFLPELSSGRRYHNLFLVGVWLTQLFTFINSTFNFFVYYIMGSRFRETFWALFNRKRKEQKQ